MAREWISEIRRSSSQEEELFRWTPANALTVVADGSVREEIEALLSDDRFMSLHGTLKLALRKRRGR